MTLAGALISPVNGQKRLEPLRPVRPASPSRPAPFQPRAVHFMFIPRF